MATPHQHPHGAVGVAGGGSSGAGAQAARAVAPYAAGGFGEHWGAVDWVLCKQRSEIGDWRVGNCFGFGKKFNFC